MERKYMSLLEPKLTEYELDALSNVFNFADGHAHNSTTLRSMYIAERFAHLCLEDIAQDKIEFEFNETFFSLAQQTSANFQRTLYCPSASISIEIVANYLRLSNLSVALIEPVFDNLADILKRHCVPLYPLREDRLRAYGVRDWIREVDADAIFLVIPNNPTGYVFSPSDFSYIVDFCVQKHKLLILDFTFRFFAPDLLQWDQYDILEQSGVRYVAIEDTGKTWPTFELKVSPLVASKTTYPQFRSIYSDIFLSLSPLTLALTREFIVESKELGLEKSIWDIPRINRSAMRATVSNTSLKPLSLANTSVEWVHIESDINDLELVDRLHAYGIYVLPGRYFFWSNVGAESKFIRVALMRDTDIFVRGMKRLREALHLVLA